MLRIPRLYPIPYTLTYTDTPQVRVIAQWLQKVDPQSDGAARDWVAIYDECSRILYQEIDYRLEGANADRFRCVSESSPPLNPPSGPHALYPSPGAPS